MKKTWAKTGLAAVFLAAAALTGCDGNVQQTAANPNAAASAPAAAPKLPEKHGAGAYYVQVRLKQSHFSLDLGTHIKDAANAVDFALPTAKARYEQLHKGEDLVDAFRAASFWISGSVGDTRMTVRDVPAVDPGADSSACRVQLELRQSHFNLNLSDHIKDAANAVKFDWDVPGNVYQNLNVGDDLIEHGFRAGSFVMHGSVGRLAPESSREKRPLHPLTKIAPDKKNRPFFRRAG